MTISWSNPEEFANGQRPGPPNGRRPHGSARNGSAHRPHNRIAGKFATAPQSAARPSVAVSVVVTVGRGSRPLDDCLAALVNQDFAAGAYEVIVVDPADGDTTRRQVERWARVSPVTFYYIPTDPAGGPAAARNLGWRLARGAVVAFTDGDCHPESSWLRVGLAAFAADTAAVWGEIAGPAGEAATRGDRQWAMPAPTALSAANLFCRRDVLATLGGFDEQFTPPGRGELDLHLALLEARLAVRYVTEARVVHAVPAGPWRCLGEERRSMFHALIYKKHPALYRTTLRELPPCRYYASVAALIGVTLAAATGGTLALELCTLAWVLLTLDLADRRLRDTAHAPTQIATTLLTSALIPPLAVFWRLCGAWRYRVFFF